MAHNNLQPTEKSPVQAATGKTSRLFFVDHLRAALVILVVLHHIALVYGGIPPFYYLEPPNPTNDLLAGLVLFAFVLFNQAWFMGAFFLIAGYFTPGSFDRKGPGSFLKDRLLRLGIPLIIFIFVLSPISNLGLYLMPASQGGITTPLTWQTFPYLAFLGLGPLWFVALLLIFSFGYAAWRMLTRNRTSTSKSKSSAPSYLSIGIFILALALASYLVRIIVPLGEPVSLFVYFLSFPTIAYLPQYLSFFVLGTVASRHKAYYPRLYGRSRLCGSGGGDSLVVLDCVYQPLNLDRERLPAITPFRLRDMAVCRIYALGLHLRSRNMPGLDPTLPPLLQRAGKVRQVPVST